MKKTLKKIVIMFLMIGMVFFLTACGDKETANENVKESSNSVSKSSKKKYEEQKEMQNILMEGAKELEAKKKDYAEEALKMAVELINVEFMSEVGVLDPNSSIIDYVTYQMISEKLESLGYKLCTKKDKEKAPNMNTPVVGDYIYFTEKESQKNIFQAEIIAKSKASITCSEVTIIEEF